MKKLIWLCFCLALFSVISSASAIEISTIPSCTSSGDCYISKNSNVIVMPSVTVSETDRVEWRTIDGETGLDSARGLFPKEGIKRFCFFSSDSSNNCGPTPLIKSVYGYDFRARLVTLAGAQSEDVVEIIPSDLILSPEIVADGSDVDLYVSYYTSEGILEDVACTVYSSGLAQESEVEMTKSVDLGRFEGSVTLSEGEHYIEFKASTDLGAKGGTVKKITIAPAPENGGENDGDDGGDDGGQEYDLAAEVAEGYIIVEESGGDGMTSALRIDNNGDSEVTGLSVSVPLSYGNDLNVILGDDSIEAGGHIDYFVEVKDVISCSCIYDTFDLLSGGEKVGEIKVRLTVSLQASSGQAECPDTDSSELSITPDPVISGSYLAVDGVTKTFILKNEGDEDIDDMNFDVSTSLSGKAMVDVDLPDGLASGAEGEIEVQLTGITDQTMSAAGKIVITTNGGNKVILVNINFYEDLSYDIATLKSQVSSLSGYTKVSFELQDIQNTLNSASEDFTYGYYSSAKSKVDEAAAKISIVETLGPLLQQQSSNQNGNDYDDYTPPSPTPSTGEFDWTLIIIVLVVIVGGAVGVWYYFSKYSGGRKDEYDDEGYYDERGPGDEEF